MAFNRMAKERIGTHQKLAVHYAGEDLAEASGEDGQTPLDHRTRLRGTQAGVGIRPLRRTGLARIPSSRDLVYCRFWVVYCRLWVPGQRAEPFFPLSPCWPCWIT